MKKLGDVVSKDLAEFLKLDPGECIPESSRGSKENLRGSADESTQTPPSVCIGTGSAAGLVPEATSQRAVFFLICLDLVGDDIHFTRSPTVNILSATGNVNLTGFVESEIEVDKF